MRGACPLSTLPVMGYLSFRKSISAVDVLLQADNTAISFTISYWISLILHTSTLCIYFPKKED